MIDRRDVAARAALALGASAALWAGLVAAVGGFTVQIGGIAALRSHSTVPAAVVATVCVALLVALGRGRAADAFAWWTAAAERWSALIAVAIAGAAVATGAAWGTHVAGGPDSYCYLSHAELLARGQVRDLQPIVATVPWPDRVATFVPNGHVPAVEPEGATVAMCASGYPLIMAAARKVGGRSAMFWVVPVLGGLAVWLTFILGRRVHGPLCGLVAAVWLASSPAFLYQIVQPMTDVPAAALWLLAIAAAIRARSAESRFGPLAAGVATGAALMVRPNLLPLAALTALVAVWRRPATVRSLAEPVAAFGLGALPFVIVTAALHDAMYGSPLKSGYGDLGELFRVQHIAPNLARYPVWLMQTETPLVALALAAPWVLRHGDRARGVWFLLAFAAATFACYLPYSVFDVWWYLRFVLPAFAPLFVLSSGVALAALSRLTPAARALAVVLFAGGLLVFHLGTANRNDVFRLQRFERRFRDGGEYVARRLPQNAVVFTVWQSGSVRFYSGRQTLLWNNMHPEWLDRSIDLLRARGYQPYFLFELNEEPEFRKRFAGHSRLADLDWPPIGDINHEVRIYDPADHDRYQSGEPIRTERIWTK